MYVQKDQEDLFKKWRYAVTTIFFDVPKNMNLLNAKQKDDMKFMEKFMEGVIKDDSKHENIDLQALIERVNFDKRWVYRGSFTSPPCIEGVFWHIIDDILPIS